MIETNMIPSMKGSKWWDIARHSPPSSTMIESSSSSSSFDVAKQHMDGRHTNVILPSIGMGSNSLQSTTNQLLNTMNLPLRKKQRKLVRDNPGVLTAIARAMKMAINECQTQFKDRRWNCPVNDWKKGKHVFGKIIQRGCRETAFVYALTSAAVAHSIARACSEGMIETCTCDYRYNRKPSGIDWEWGGCSDNIDFGYKFARQFVDSAERGRDLRFVMNLHNNEAGRLHVSNEMRRECKCHGMSGSCTLQTCWMRLPSFRDIGNNLKDRFDGASRVSISNEYRGFTRKMMKHVQLKPYESGYKTPTREDLIYFEESPDFCVPNHKYGVMGTQGRTCNASSIGVEGCHLLCCGRGYITEEIEEYERCNCTFHWCCQVNCKICKIKKKIYRCT
ncbi:protein wnt-1-like [Dermatophagoides farinae]|uniref:Protein Wnt n=1 Tax=Dermatophagoides farinae TaxID=6954 RepID=A0A9D4P7K9_DERFA|nr:protein wnt-1-like [Dermatophagoides farinae]